MLNDTLKKLVRELISLDDIYGKYDECRRPIIHPNEEECMRDVEEGLKVVAKNWRDLKRRLKPILKESQRERRKDDKLNVYLDGIDRIVKHIQV